MQVFYRVSFDCCVYAVYLACLMKSLLSLGSLIDKTLEHYKTHAPSLLGVTFWLLVAGLPSGLGIVLSQDGNDLSFTTWTSFGLNIVGGIITLFASLHIAVALVLSLRDQGRGKHTDPRTVLKQAFSYDIPYIWAMLLKNVYSVVLPLLPLVLSGVLLAFTMESSSAFIGTAVSLTILGAVLYGLVVGLKYLITFNFVPYTTLLADERGMKSLRASSALVKGRWWPTLWRVLLPKALYTLIFAIILAAILWGTSTVAVAVSQDSFYLAKFFALLNFFISTLLNALLLPLLIVNDYYVYENLEATRE